MEIRLTAAATDSLATKVVFCDEPGFEVASVIVMGEREAVLIDAQWTLSNAHRLIAEILDTGRRLTTIFITHAHPDHYFGVGTIAEAFPQARVLAMPEDADMINSQFFGKAEIWETVIGAHNVCRKTVNVQPLDDDHLELEGHRLEILPRVMGDMRYNTMVWIPSIKTLYASDVLFNQAHPFTCEITADERRQWIAEIDKIETMGAEVIIPGHQKPQSRASARLRAESCQEALGYPLPIVAEAEGEVIRGLVLVTILKGIYLQHDVRRGYPTLPWEAGRPE
ncbi:MAG: MBL fold metallo-hydrolase [Thermoleophilia bacterium]